MLATPPTTSGHISVIVRTFLVIVALELACCSDGADYRAHDVLVRAVDRQHGTFWNTMERSRIRQQVKAARTLGVIMAFLLFCWLPYSILWPIKTFCPDCVVQHTYDLAVWTNYLNSAVNPIIYCLCNPRFRKAFKRMVTRK